MKSHVKSTAIHARGIGRAGFITCLAVGAAAALTSCRSHPTVAPIADVNSPESASLFIQYSYESAASAPCALRLEERASGAATLVAFPATESDVAVAVAPGAYVPVRLECASGKSEVLSGLPEMRVYPGAAAYAGFWIIQAPRVGLIGLRVGPRRRSLASLKGAIAKWPVREAARLVSAYTGKRITGEMLDGPLRDSHEVSGLGVSSGISSAAIVGLTKALGACVRAETSRNPMPVGEARIEAQFKAGRMVDYQSGGANAHSDAFSECVSLTFRSTKAPALGRVRFRF